MLIVRSSDYRRMPWKNGGGETREVIVSPPGAAFDSLDWRVSLATVTSDGPFSVFVGMQRTLCVIRGAGIRLQVGDTSPSTLFQNSAPCTFDGETPTRAFLVDGAIVDLNVMSRRARFRHTVKRLALTGTLELEVNARTTIVFCQRGDLLCVAGNRTGYVGPEDCVVVDHEAERIRLITGIPTEILLVEILPKSEPNQPFPKLVSCFLA
jgi:environmental stress-induced protein Ves